MGIHVRAAVVTGAYGAIGFAAALALAKRGVALSLLGRKIHRLNEAADAVELACAKRPLVKVADVRRPAEVSQAFESTRTAFGSVDIVIHTAAVGGIVGIVRGDKCDWDRQWETNVIGTAVVARESLNVFDMKMPGHLIVLSSTSGRRLHEASGFYGITKIATSSLVDVLRMELATMGSPHKVTALSPGRVRSELFGSDTRFEIEPLDPSEVAEVIINVLESPARGLIDDVVMRARGQVI
jgi:NADP-dependent 3-hydroxy acid dehydrogenase YdfG